MRICTLLPAHRRANALTQRLIAADVYLHPTTCTQTRNKADTPGMTRNANSMAKTTDCALVKGHVQLHDEALEVSKQQPLVSCCPKPLVNERLVPAHLQLAWQARVRPETKPSESSCADIGLDNISMHCSACMRHRRTSKQAPLAGKSYALRARPA